MTAAAGAGAHLRLLASTADRHGCTGSAGRPAEPAVSALALRKATSAGQQDERQLNRQTSVNVWLEQPAQFTVTSFNPDGQHHYLK